jgi:NodT family efflux transporter outer membrane factor (OMF) lipoprotein
VANQSPKPNRCKTRHVQAKPPAPPVQVQCLRWWGRRFRLPWWLAAELCILTLLTLTGCTLGPNYHRPTVSLPDQFRGEQPAEAAASLADIKFADLFHDEALTALLNKSLQNNFDVRASAERILQARAEVGITRANQFPFLDANASFNGVKSSARGAFPFPPGTKLSASYTQAGASLSWEIDIWGRYRRLTEAARAQYAATEEARHGVIVSLIGDVMTSYFTLVEQDLELDIANHTRDVANDNLRLVNLRHDRGAITALDVHQAEQLLYTATSQIEAVKRNIGQTEDALSLLLGEAPHDIVRDRKLEQITLPAELPSGLPSSLIARRPDILQEESLLKAANAQIGAARALYFPNISLTASASGQSRELLQLVSTPAAVLSIAPSAVQPIFHAGQIKNTVLLSEAQEREALINYQKSIYGALREVSDALIGHQGLRAQRTEEEKLVGALSESVRLSNLRYKGGLDSYLQVLDAERNLFSGQLVLSQLRLQELLSIVNLYRALGGGWS